MSPAEKKNISVTLDARMIYHSGIGTYLQNIIPLISDSIDLTLLGNEKLFSEFPWRNKVKIIELNSRIYSISEQFEIPSKMKRADVFWSPHLNSPLLPVRAATKLLTVHDVYHLAFRNKLSALQKFYSSLVIKNVIKQADRIITVSEFTKSELLKYTRVNPERISVVHNGIDRSRFRIIKDNRLLDSVRRKYSLPEKFLLFVGNLKPHKNLVKLLLAFEEISERNPEYHLVIAGKSEGMITTDKEIIKFTSGNIGFSGKVHFTGELKNEDIAVIYNLAEAFIFPSVYEGFGLPVLEAMACGCPVISSNAASLPEVCGDAAYYFKPHDVKDIARAVSEVLSDRNLRQDLIARGLKRADLFSWETSAEKTLEIIKGCVN